MQLHIPRPTSVPDDVLQAMSKQMVNHRSPDFVELTRFATALGR